MGAVVNVDRKDEGRVMLRLRHIPSEDGVGGFRQSFFFFKITCPCCCELEEGRRKICLLPEL